MEHALKEAIGTTILKSTGKGGGGCINSGKGYLTDQGEIFVKENTKSKAKLMFDGEFASLKAIAQTKTVRVPKPLVVFTLPNGGAALAMEFIDMSRLSKHSDRLGELLAKLHLFNIEKIKADQKRKSFITKGEPSNEETDDSMPPVVTQFGFPVTTCCGYLEMDNSWHSDWVEFYARQRLAWQIGMLEGDRELNELWSQLSLQIPSFFKESPPIEPALLHGDLWKGNAAETPEEPIVFDPASFYGHAEFDLSIASMFGGFSSSFFESYHNLMPKSPGFSKRSLLYKLYHYLNHWNHFGTSYRGSTISTMKSLLQK